MDQLTIKMDKWDADRLRVWAVEWLERLADERDSKAMTHAQWEEHKENVRMFERVVEAIDGEE